MFNVIAGKVKLCIYLTYVTNLPNHSDENSLENLF